LFDQVTGTVEWHINADETAAIDYNLDFSRNASILMEQQH
jgi:predicted extracellular nuclease